MGTVQDWAGPQRDFWVKVEAGQIGLPEFTTFLNMTSEQRRKDLAPYMADPRFKLADAFDLIVPDGYDHDTCLTTFVAAHGSEFVYRNPNITDDNFRQATTKLVPGRELRVKIFQITETVTSEDCLTFLRSQKAVLVGAQGASLVYELAKGRLPKGRWSVSFDEKVALPVIDGSRRVPGVDRYSDGDFGLSLGFFEYDWGDGGCILVFCD
jgi:hypothetical protein